MKTKGYNKHSNFILNPSFLTKPEKYTSQISSLTLKMKTHH